MKQQKFFGIILVICVLVTLRCILLSIDILLVCVDKEHQGKGIATELVDFAKKMSDDNGVTRYSLVYQKEPNL